MVYNPRSGALANGAASVEARLTGLFRQRGVIPALRPFRPATAPRDVRELLADRPRALIVIGGDGTVRSVATCLLGGEVPLGILPAGTMNVLARDLGIPEDLDTALHDLLKAPERRIDVARVNGRPFLCSSALAMMPHLGRIRERARGADGWSVLRQWNHGLRVLSRYPRRSFRIIVDGEEHTVRSRALVISNNPLSRRPAALVERDRLDTGWLVVYTLRDRTLWDLVHLASKLLDGTWQADRRIRSYRGREVRVEGIGDATTSVMSDGEVERLAAPLNYDVQPRALAVLAPRRSAAS